MNDNGKKKRKGLFIDLDILLDTRLSHTAQIILAQIRLMHENTKNVFISDEWISQKYRIALRTASRVIVFLDEIGLISIKRARRGVRYLVPAPMVVVTDNEFEPPKRDSTTTAKSDINNGQKRHQQQPIATSITAKLADPSDNISVKTLALEKEKERERDTAREVPLSFSSENTESVDDDTDEPDNLNEVAPVITAPVPATLKETAGVSAPAVSAVPRLTGLLGRCQNWLDQLASTTVNRLWVHNTKTGKEVRTQLTRRGAARVSQADLAALRALSAELMPNAVTVDDGVMQILRSSSVSKADRWKAHEISATSSVIRLGRLVSWCVGAFFRERSSASYKLPTPIMGVPSPELAVELQDAAANLDPAYADPSWFQCFLEASAAYAASGATAAAFIACADAVRGETPLPWIACTITKSAVEADVARREAHSRAACKGWLLDWNFGIKNVIAYITAGMSETGALLNPMTSFPSWFRVLYSESFNERIFDLWGEEALKEFTSSRELRTFARQMTPKMFQELEARWGAFPDSPSIDSPCPVASILESPNLLPDTGCGAEVSTQLAARDEDGCSALGSRFRTSTTCTRAE